MSVRVTTSNGEQRRATVNGRRVRLPAIGRLLTACREHDAHWNYRFIEGFDCGFFLPEEDASDTGLLLAYNARQDLTLNGFEHV